MARIPALTLCFALMWKFAFTADFCNKILTCDYYVDCLVKGIDETVKQNVLNSWNEIRVQSCNEAQFYHGGSESKHCISLLDSTEVQLAFLMQGLQYDLLADRQFYWFENNPLPRDSAQAACANGGGTLAKLHKPKEGLAYCSVIKTRNHSDSSSDKAWIGAKIMPVGTSTKLVWSDNSEVEKTNYWKKEVTNLCSSTHPCDCVYAMLNNSLLWRRTICAETITYICSYDVIINQIALQYYNSLTAVISHQAPDPGNVVKLQNQFSDVAVGSKHIENLQFVKENSYDVIIAKWPVLNATQIIQQVALQLSNVSYTMKVTGDRLLVPLSEVEVNLTESQQFIPNPDEPLVTEAFIPPEVVPFVTLTGFAIDGLSDLEQNNSLQGTLKLLRNTSVEIRACRFVDKYKGNEGFLQTFQRVDVIDDVCVFVDPATSNYSKLGCTTTIDKDNGIVSCSCNHLSVFAVLMSVRMTKIPIGVKICSLATSLISDAALIATVAILVRFRKKKTDDRILVKINFCVSLFVLHALSILHDLALPMDNACIAFTILTHYFLLTTSMWMLVEGIRVVMATSDPMKFHVQDEMKRFYVFLGIGWLVPFVIVGTAVGVGFYLKNYIIPSSFYTKCNKFRPPGNQLPKFELCWLTPATEIYYASVMTPLASVVCVNIVICGKVMHTLLAPKMSHNKQPVDRVDEVINALKSLMVLIVLLGAPWGIGFFTGLDNKITGQIFMYIHVVVNGMQGAALFFLYCFLDDEIREKIFPKRRKKEKKVAETKDGRVIAEVKRIEGGPSKDCYTRNPNNTAEIMVLTKIESKQVD